jgi:WD40 repeat protein
MPYNAFISYCHATDVTLAAALQSALHSFARPWYKLRALHIFRDQTNLAVNPALWSSIREALDQSLYLILLASPEAAASPWVAQEAGYWIAKNGTSRVLIVLTGGTLKWDHVAACISSEQTNSLPTGLLHSFPEEPLFLDLRWARDPDARLSMREPRFHEAVLQLAATLHNRPKDELDGADIRIRRQTRWLIASGLASILLIALFALYQSRRSQIVSIQNLAASLAVSSAKVLADSPDRAREAALLAIESNRLHPSFEANQALRGAVSLLPASEQLYNPEDASPAERVRDIAFAPDGAILAVGRDDGSTQLFDLERQKPIGYLTPDEHPAGHIELSGEPQGASFDDNSAVSVSFNSSGTLLATGTRDAMAHIWTVPGGREVLRISHGVPVSQVAFHPKTDQLITASDDGHLRIFDVSRSAMVADFKCPGKIASASFSPNGDLLAALSSEGSVSLFDPVHRKLLRTLAGGEAGFNLAFSGNGKRLAMASGDYAFVWDTDTGQQLLKATHAASSETLTPLQWIDNAAITADGKFLAYGARGDHLAHVWNVDTGRQVLELKHDSVVEDVAFNADGTKLGTGSDDGTARVWELPSGRELERAALAGGTEVVTFNTATGRFAAGGSAGVVLVSETRRADRPAYFDLPSDVRSVAFSPDGRRFAIAARSPRWLSLVRIADIGGKTVRDIEFRGAPVLDKLFFLDANDVIAQWSNNLFHLALDPPAVTPLPELPGEARIGPSGKSLAIQRDGITRLYTLPGLQLATSLDDPSSSQLRAADDGRFLAFETNKPPNEFFVDIWGLAGKARVSRILLPAESNHLAFNPAGTILFSAQSENLQAWDVPSGKRRFALTASAEIDQIVPDSSSAFFATVSHGRLTVWDGATGVRLAELPDMGYLRSAAFSPDDRYLLAGYDENAAALWLWRTEDLREQACARIALNFSHDEWKRYFPRQPYRQTCTNVPAN